MSAASQVARHDQRFRGSRARFALTAVGSVLLVAAATVILLQVRVGAPGQEGRSCGSSLDVITDRTGWEVWYAQDSADIPAGSPAPLLRTLRCPDAVNARSIVAGVLGALGVLALLGAAALRRARPASAAPSRALVVRLQRLGAVVTMVGVVLAFAGLFALGVVLADRDAALFVYVRRATVAAIGVVVLAPVLALVAAGRALAILARGLADRESGSDETV